MGTDKEDTDPSSPSALRPRVGFEVSSAAERDPVDFPSTSDSKPKTDPGLGPRPASDPPPPLTTRSQSHGVIVPPPSTRPVSSGSSGARAGSSPSAITPPEFAPVSRSLAAPPSLAKDSVELLLEGMAGPRPDRRKTMPQSDGEASAAYHAEHGVRPARSSSEPGPKVVVEKPSPSAPRTPRPVTTVPGRPKKIEAAGSREALSTFVPGKLLRRRVALAVMAGVLIVLLSFMALRLTEKHPGESASAAKAAPVLVPERPAPSAATAQMQAMPAAPPVIPVAAPPPAPVEPAPAPEEPSAPGTARASTGARHHHTPGEAASAAPADLGEFKARF